MDRTNFFDVTDIGNGPEYDHMYTNLSKFTMTYPVQYYRVSEEDTMRPDLISYKAYGSVAYWWLILLVNGVQDVFTGMNVGDLYKLPNILDIYTFYKQYSFR